MDVSSYLDAMVALREFRIMVCQKCRTVLTSRLINFERAIGLTLSPDNRIKDHISHDNPNKPRNFDGSWAWVAVRIELPGYGWAYFGLMWVMHEPRVIAALKFRDLRLFREASLRVASSVPVFEIYANEKEREVMLYKPIRADQFRDFEGILTRVIDEWSRVWRDIGGLSALHVSP